MPSFLVNYGGPRTPLSTSSLSFPKIFEACEEFYQSQLKSTSFTVKGLDVTYYQVGIHRMVKVDLPEQVLENLKSKNAAIKNKAMETRKLFYTAQSSASDFNTKDYKLLENNCVSAVANVLNTIEPKLLGGAHKIVPLVLDDNMDEALELDAKVDGILRGTTLLSQQKQPHKNYQQAHVPSELWEEVMTPVAQQHQKELKQKLQQSKYKNQSEEDVAHKIWEEAMTFVGKPNS